MVSRAKNHRLISEPVWHVESDGRKTSVSLGYGMYLRSIFDRFSHMLLKSILTGCCCLAFQACCRLAFQMTGCWHRISSIAGCAQLASWPISKVCEHDCYFITRSIWKTLGPFATASRRTPPVLILHCQSPGVATVDTTTKMSRSQL